MTMRNVIGSPRGHKPVNLLFQRPSTLVYTRSLGLLCRSKTRSHQCCVHFLLQSAGRLDKPLIITANTSVVASVCALTALDQKTSPPPPDHGLTNLSRIKVWVGDYYSQAFGSAAFIQWECDDVALLLPNAHRLLGYAVMAARLQWVEWICISNVVKH